MEPRWRNFITQLSVCDVGEDARISGIYSGTLDSSRILVMFTIHGCRGSFDQESGGAVSRPVG